MKAILRNDTKTLREIYTKWYIETLREHSTYYLHEKFIKHKFLCLFSLVSVSGGAWGVVNFRESLSTGFADMLRQMAFLQISWMQWHSCIILARILQDLASDKTSVYTLCSDKLCISTKSKHNKLLEIKFDELYTCLTYFCNRTSQKHQRPEIFWNHKI